MLVRMYVFIYYVHVYKFNYENCLPLVLKLNLNPDRLAGVTVLTALTEDLLDPCHKIEQQNSKFHEKLACHEVVQLLYHQLF